jgi:hypothetical protein
MNLTFGRAAIAAILFLGSQVAPGLHAAFEAGHDLHACCTDGEAAVHFDACAADHHAPECSVCAIVRAPSAAVVESSAPSATVAVLPVESIPCSSVVDPFHVDTPDSRGPPA